MNLHVTNVVVKTDLKCGLNLLYVVKHVANAIYNPCKYSGMIWKHKKIKSKCFLFHTGSIMCMGNDSIYRAKQDIRKYARLITKLGYKVDIGHIRTITRSAVATLSGRLDCRQVCIFLNGFYDPELFNAIMVRKEYAHFTCFLSGKIIMTGVKSLKKVHNLLMDLDLFTL
jgi:TATA-box binding protein (TBP) (component of TFIID and TFIIIB)